MLLPGQVLNPVLPACDFPLVPVLDPVLAPVLLPSLVLSPVLPAQVLPCELVLDPVCSPVLLPEPLPVPLPTQTAPVQDPVLAPELLPGPLPTQPPPVLDPGPLLLFTLCIRILRAEVALTDFHGDEENFFVEKKSKIASINPTYLRTNP